MPLYDREESFRIADRLLERSAADQTEVSVSSVTDAFVRFAGTGPTQCADREKVEVAVRVRLSGEGGVREARATCTSSEDAAVDAALDRAMALARLSPDNPDLPPLGGAVEVPETAADRPTLDHDFGEKARWVRSGIDACAAEELEPAGLVQTTGESRAIANSTGRRVHGYSTRASFALTASAIGGAGGSGRGESIASSVDRVDPGLAIRRAVDKASRGREPVPIEPGEYTVVLEPSAVSSILLFASYMGFGAREVEEKASFLCGRMGERLFPDELEICDDAGNPVYPGLPFDAEGTPKQKVPLLAEGCLTGPVTDRTHAHKRGEESTGHALPQPNTHGPMASNLVVGEGRHSLDELVSGVDRGLLVTQFHYTNMIEPTDLVLTGMTRNGTFLIEGGEVRQAVRNLRFTQSLVDALSKVTGVGRDREVVGALFEGEAVVPALRIDGYRFTSSTDF